MIENEQLGLKVAENKEEAFWEKVQEEANLRVESFRHEIIINEEIIKLADRKLKEFAVAKNIV